MRGCCEDCMADGRLGLPLKNAPRDGGMKSWREGERQTRVTERGRVREARQKDFTVFLTGRPEGHTQTQSQRCVCDERMASWGG